MMVTSTAKLVLVAQTNNWPSEKSNSKPIYKMPMALKSAPGAQGSRGAPAACYCYCYCLPLLLLLLPTAIAIAIAPPLPLPPHQRGESASSVYNKHLTYGGGAISKLHFDIAVPFRACGKTHTQQHDCVPSGKEGACKK